MQGNEGVWKRQIGGKAGLSLWKQADEGVDHDVADEVNLFAIDAFAEEILVTVGRWREEQIGELVGEQAVDFFRHGAVAGAQSGLDVADGYSELGANQRGRDG